MLGERIKQLKDRSIADMYSLSPCATRVSHIGSDELNKQRNSPSKPRYSCGRLNAYLISFSIYFTSSQVIISGT